MATVLRVSDTFAAGTSVGAYTTPDWAQRAPSGAPPVAATQAVTVASDGTATFTALTPGRRYYAAAQVSGTWRHVMFTAEDTVEITIDDGDNQYIYTDGILPLKSRIEHGSSASPITASGPTVKVSRTQQVTVATIEAVGGVGTDGSEQLAAIYGVNVATASDEVQPVGIMGAAKSSSTVGAPGNDACGVYGLGRIIGSGTGLGIGGFMAGRRDTDTGKANGVEAHVSNRTATAGTYNSTGFSNTTGIWVNCSGDSDSGVGIAVSNGFGRQYKVGIGFPAQVNGGLTGGVSDTSIRDDGNATTSYAINGTHTDAMALGATAGPIKFTERSADPAAPAANEVRLYSKDNGSGKTGLYAIFNTGAVQQVALQP